MNFREINIDDRTIFNHFLSQHNPQASEMSFLNFFMWRDFYNFKFAIISDMLCIIGNPKDSAPFACIPFGLPSEENYPKVIKALKDYFKSKGWQLRFVSVPEKEVTYLKTFAGSNLDIVLDRDHSDYVYSSENLIYLKGKKYDGKRNHINKFKKLYNYEYYSLTSDHVGDCERILDEWFESKNNENPIDFYHEKSAYMEILKNFNLLGCKGAIIKVNGKFEGFTLGEMLNSNTAVIHIEKANSSIHGLYTFLNQQFCENEWMDTEYINREQDLGIAGLRKAKLSYNPVMLVDKYIVTFI